MIKNSIDTALICLSHALEEPISAETYVHMAMDELEVCARYAHERQTLHYFQRELSDDDNEEC